jgi:hypothetical protein
MKGDSQERTVLEGIAICLPLPFADTQPFDPGKAFSSIDQQSR